MTIWKYEIPVKRDGGGGVIVNEQFSIEMPSNAQILSVAMQDRRPVFWALIGTTTTKETRRFMVTGTGHDVLTDSFGYCGTFQDGWFVGHLIEVWD